MRLRPRPHREPTNLAEAIRAIEAGRTARRWLALGVALLVVALPLVTWLAITIGDRGRAQNCDAIESALLGLNHANIAGLVQAATDPEDTPEEIADRLNRAAAYEDQVAEDVLGLMEGCDR